MNEALDELAKVDSRLTQVVEMRYFGGLEEREIAAALAITERTVRRDWKKARMLSVGGASVVYETVRRAIRSTLKVSRCRHGSVAW